MEHYGVTGAGKGTWDGNSVQKIEDNTNGFGDHKYPIMSAIPTTEEVGRAKALRDLFSGQTPDASQFDGGPIKTWMDSYFREIPENDASGSITKSMQAIADRPVLASVTGDIKGETTVVVRFEGGDGLIKILDNNKSAVAQLAGRINPNGAGSTGKGSHDALPGVRGDLMDYTK